MFREITIVASGWLVWACIANQSLAQEAKSLQAAFPDLLQGAKSKGEEPRIKTMLLQKLLYPPESLIDALGDEERLKLNALRKEWSTPTYELQRDPDGFTGDDQLTRDMIRDAWTDGFIETVQSELPGIYSAVISDLNRSFLANEVRAPRGESSESDLNTSGLDLLLAPTLVKRLALSETEIDAWHHVLERAENKAQAVDKELLDRLVALWRERVRALLGVLTVEQRQLYAKIFGDVVSWESIAEDLRERLQQRVASLSKPGSEISKSAYHADLEPLHLDYIWFTVFSLRNLWDQLEMTGQQEKDASELLERIEKSSVLKASATSDRALRLLDGGIDVPECINEVLLEHQKQRLCQLELQFRLLGTWNSCYLLDPRVELKLGLTAAQIPEITQLTEKADEKRAAARKAAETEIKEIRATALRDATAGLSAAQRKLLARLIGHW